MNPYALKHAIAEVKSELANAGISILSFDDSEFIDWAFRILLIAEMKQLNKNIEHVTDVIKRIK